MQVHQILAGKNINAIWSITPEATVYEALQVMAEKNIGVVMVIVNNKLVGIFSERDYARKVVLHGKSSRNTLISEVMTANVVTVNSKQKIEECMQLMSDLHIRHLPVIDEDRLKGIISINDIVDSIIREQKVRIQSLESYISGSPF